MKYAKWSSWQAVLGMVFAIAWWSTSAMAEGTAVVSESLVVAGAQVAAQSPEAPAAAAEAPHPRSVDPRSGALLAEELPEAPEDDIWSISMRLGLGLALVVLLAWGAAHVLRKSTLGRQLGADNSLIRVAERAYLGPKKAVFLVEIGDRALALGVTDEHIATLAEWEAGSLDLSPPAEKASPFAAQLKSVLKHTTQEGR